jgi:histidine triad (HIT) family protein
MIGMFDCVFCKIREGKIAANFIHEDDLCFAFRDVNPMAPTHLLVVPKKHVPSLNDVTEEDAPLLGHLFVVAKNLAASEGTAAEGWRTVFNVNAAGGQHVFHIHLHLLGGRRFGWPPG